MTSADSLPILHVLVVGFHHKKGCQVEYSYPPLMGPDSDPHSAEVPSQWRQLPSLALPDGSHNYSEDTAFFHLPALDNPRKTVFGISCYRQISVEQVVNRTADITRDTVQKSVCVLSRLPLYGQIQVKMSLITEAYFKEGDFTHVELIHQTYANLNSCLTDDMLRTQQLYVGLSASDFVRRFKQHSLVLFKLLLLERKVLFFQSPVKDLCEAFLTLLSLHPGMLESGLDEAARMVPTDTPPSTSPCPQEELQDRDDGRRPSVTSVDNSAGGGGGGIKGKLSGALEYITGYKDKEVEEDKAEEALDLPPCFESVASLSTEDFGLPLNIFTGGNLCHPYLSLSYLDVLTQPSVHGYLIGATNILFKQKKGVAEVVVDMEKDKCEVNDPELKRALALTTEDLRFVDNVVKHCSCSGDAFLDGVGWEGGDEWVRAQFRFYLVCLLRSSLVESDASAAEALFNPVFVSLWKQSRNYRHWRARMTSTPLIGDTICALPPGHPFSGGHLSMTDVKLHLSNTITNTEGGKKVSQVVSSTGKAMAGGLSSAKGAFSSFITSLRQPAAPAISPPNRSPRSDSPEVEITENEQ